MILPVYLYKHMRSQRGKSRETYCHFSHIPLERYKRDVGLLECQDTLSKSRRADLRSLSYGGDDTLDPSECRSEVRKAPDGDVRDLTVAVIRIRLTVIFFAAGERENGRFIGTKPGLKRKRRIEVRYAQPETDRPNVPENERQTKIVTGMELILRKQTAGEREECRQPEREASSTLFPAVISGRRTLLGVFARTLCFLTELRDNSGPGSKT